jgi:hypothetical protein
MILKRQDFGMKMVQIYREMVRGQRLTLGEVNVRRKTSLIVKCADA